MALDRVAAHRLRSFLSALGVLVGVAGVVAIQGVLNGADRLFLATLSNLGPSVAHLTNRPLLDESRGAGWPRVTLEEADYLRDRLTTARAVVPVQEIHLNAKDSNRASDLTVDIGRERIVELDLSGSTEDWPALGPSIAEGRFFTALERQAMRPVVVVGADLWDVMRRQGLGLSDRILIGGVQHQVTGVIQRRGRGLYGSLDSTAVLPLGLFQRYFGGERSVTVGLVAADPQGLWPMVEEATVAMRARRRLPPQQEENFAVLAAEQAMELYRNVTALLTAATAALAVVALLVAGGGIMNIMLVSVAERTREIGVLRAVGARGEAIAGQLLAEAILVSGTGALGGLALGAAATRAVAAFSPLPAAITTGTLAVGFSYGVSIGLVFAVIPAVRAARMIPAEALRTAA